MGRVAGVLRIGRRSMAGRCASVGWPGRAAVARLGRAGLAGRI